MTRAHGWYVRKAVKRTLQREVMMIQTADDGTVGWGQKNEVFMRPESNGSKRSQPHPSSACLLQALRRQGELLVFVELSWFPRVLLFGSLLSTRNK